MKIIVEILQEKIDDENRKNYEVIKSKTVIISNVKNTTTINEAKDKLLQLKSTLPSNQKIRVLEFHNDEFGDKNRKPCKILFEG